MLYALKVDRVAGVHTVRGDGHVARQLAVLPHFCAVQGKGQTREGRHYYVMELQGRNLAQLAASEGKRHQALAKF
ncbi:hypothetical protein H632_c4881p0, partial [Helicosporidium sp. ATCC 50920]